MNTHRRIAGVFITVFCLTYSLLYAAAVFADGVNPVIGKWGYSRLEHYNSGDWGAEGGVVTFNADSTGTIVLKYNEDGTLGSETDNFTYTIASNPNGSYSLSMTDASGTYVKNIVFSDNGNMFIQDDTASAYNQKMFFAVKMDAAKNYTNADFSGDYYVIGYDYDIEGTEWPGYYIASSATVTSNGKGNMSRTRTWNGDGIIRNDIWTESYTIYPDGSIRNIGFLSGDGKLIAGSSANRNTDDWGNGFVMKNGDKVYSNADLAGTWAIEGFGDEYGSSFNEEFGIMTCDSSGNCTGSLKNQRDGNLTFEILNFNASVASEASGSL